MSGPAPADLPAAREVLRAPLPRKADDRVSLAHHERLLRRRRLEGEGGAFLVDLPATVSLRQGDAFALEDGRLVEVVAAPEALIAATAQNLARIAWHVGNRHAPCQVEPGRLLVLRDRVMRDMLLRLGAAVEDVDAPFTPEGGAYGEGHPMGHTHLGDADSLGLGDLGGEPL